jgi:hypothetical protein
MWLAMPRGALELGAFVGGLERGIVLLLLFQCAGGEGGSVKYISDRFSISKWFPFSFADVHSVSGFIITPRSAKYEVHEAVKEDPCLVRYDAMLDRKIVTTRLRAPCIQRRGCQIMAFESVEYRVVVIPARWWQQATTKRQYLPVDPASYPRIH